MGRVLLLVVNVLLLSLASSTSTVIQSSCIAAIPVIPTTGPGCSVPANVDVSEFGDNANSQGFMRVRPRSDGMDVFISLRDLSKPNLVLTAWIIWTLPGDPSNPPVFQVAEIASPLTPWTASFATGLNKEPNQFTNVGTRAFLRTRLNFNPTHPNEGALARGTYCFQKDVPGIQSTAYRQYEIPGSGGLFSPTSSSYLRQYDPATGFEKLGPDGRPELVKSPIRAYGVAVAAHIDKTTHGVSQGYFGTDHFEVMSFLFTGPIGNPTAR